jgi:hypothetical protein
VLEGLPLVAIRIETYEAFDPVGWDVIDIYADKW